MRSCAACGEIYSTISELCFHQIETHGRIYDEDEEPVPKKKKFTEDSVFFGKEKRECEEFSVEVNSAVMENLENEENMEIRENFENGENVVSIENIANLENIANIANITNIANMENITNITNNTNKTSISKPEPQKTPKIKIKTLPVKPNETTKHYSCNNCNPDKIYKTKEAYKKHKNSHKHFHVLAISKNQNCPVCDASTLDDVTCKCQHKS